MTIHNDNSRVVKGLIDRVPNWPENARMGSRSMHMHFTELIDAWNFHVRSDVDNVLGLGFMDPEMEALGKSIAVFPDTHSAGMFIRKFELEDFARFNGEKVVLRNKFPWRYLQPFFNTLDIERIEMMNANREWTTLRPTLGDVFMHSGRILHKLQRSHDEIAKARRNLGRLTAKED